MSKSEDPTAEELLAELANDPDYVAMRAERELQRHGDLERTLAVEAPVIGDLRRAGLQVEFISDLYDQAHDYRPFLGILVDHLLRATDDDLKHALIRAVSVPWARGNRALSTWLVREFRSSSDPHLRWAIANALEVVATDAEYSELESLVTDPRYGEARQMLVLALGRVDGPNRADVLSRLLHDDDVCGHAVIAIRRAQLSELLSDVEATTTHRADWIREEARKTVKRLQAQDHPGGA